jgi:CheY-like chemotaxis protein
MRTLPEPDDALRRLADVLADLATVVLGRTSLLLQVEDPGGERARVLRELHACATAGSAAARAALLDVTRPAPAALRRAVALGDLLGGGVAALRLELGTDVRVLLEPAPAGVWSRAEEPVVREALAATGHELAPQALLVRGGITVRALDRAPQGLAHTGGAGQAWVDVALGLARHAEPMRAIDAWQPAGGSVRIERVQTMLARAGGALWSPACEGAAERYLLALPTCAPDLGADDGLRDRATWELVRGEGEAVLVVCEEPRLAGYLDDCLRYLSYRPVRCDDAQEALARAGTGMGKPDLLLLDVRALGTDAQQTRRRLEEAYPEAGHVCVTGPRAGALAASGRGRREPSLLRRPFAPEELAQALHLTLRRPPRARGGTTSASIAG